MYIYVCVSLSLGYLVLLHRLLRFYPLYEPTANNDEHVILYGCQKRARARARAPDRFVRGSFNSFRFVRLAMANRADAFSRANKFIITRGFRPDPERASPVPGN